MMCLFNDILHAPGRVQCPNLGLAELLGLVVKMKSRKKLGTACDGKLGAHMNAGSMNFS